MTSIHVRLVKKLGGEEIGPFFVALIPQVGDVIIADPSNHYKVQAVGHLATKNPALMRGAVLELEVEKL